MSGFEHSCAYWLSHDEQLKADTKIDKSFCHVASDEAIAHTKAALEKKTFHCDVVATKHDALELIKKCIPKGASVHNAGSTTLAEIGYTEYLKSGAHGWNNLHEAILKEADPAKQGKLRREASCADYFVSSVCAVSEQGDIVVVDLTGTRTAPFTYDANKVVVVIGANKIVKDYETAVRRANEFCLPVESARVRVAYGVPASSINNFVAIRGPNPWGAPGRFHVIIVKEALGF